MASAGEPEPSPPAPSVFLSYASEDRDAARSIRDCMAGSGIEVWYDENELGGGDEWDQKIRRQIRECDYFMAVISAQTEARHEGYFRREWRLAVDRTLDMADGHLFLIPVVVDDTDQASARVPDRFTAVQWIKVPQGRPSPSLKALCARLVSGNTGAAKPAPRRAGSRAPVAAAQAPQGVVPEFPVEEPGQRVKFWVHVVAWVLKAALIQFRRLPRWARLLITLWLCVILISRGCSVSREAKGTITPESAAKLKAISNEYQGSLNKADIGKLGVEIAKAFDDEDTPASAHSPVLAIPFSGATADAAQSKLADSAFALVYGRLSIAHAGKVGLSKEPLGALDASAGADRGREHHSRYVVCGGITASGATAALTVDIVSVRDGTVAWTGSYPVAGTDPATIAADVDAHLPSLDDE